MKFSKQLRFILYSVSLEAIHCLYYDLVSITENLSVEDGNMYETHSPMCAICCGISEAQQHIDNSDSINIGTYQGSLQKTLEQRFEEM